MVSPAIGLTAVDEAVRAGLMAPPPGTHHQETIGPSYADLTTMKTASPGFPIYPDLTQLLLSLRKHPDEVVAHALATCAGYAYSDAETVATVMTRIGLEKNHCAMIARNVDAMFICSTAFLVQSKDGRVVILCYRGTEPLNFINWLGTGDVAPEKVCISVAAVPAVASGCTAGSTGTNESPVMTSSPPWAAP
jgi:hypothetical protein